MRNLDEYLESIEKSIIELINRVDRSLEITKEISGKSNFDKALYGEVKVIEEEADDLELTIDEISITAIARFQPAASDLRYLVKIMEMTTDLERITDLTVGILKFYKKAEKMGYKKSNLLIIKNLSGKVKALFELFKAGFIEKSSQNIYMILGLDDEVNELRADAIKLSIETMKESVDNINCGVQDIVVAQKYERIADIIQNLAESYIYISKGKDIRHQN